MKKTILTSLIALTALTSILSTDIKPAEASAGSALYNVGRSTYNAIENGDEETANTGFWLMGIIVFGGIACASNKS